MRDDAAKAAQFAEAIRIGHQVDAGTLRDFGGGRIRRAVIDDVDVLPRHTGGHDAVEAPSDEEFFVERRDHDAQPRRHRRRRSRWRPILARSHRP